MSDLPNCMYDYRHEAPSPRIVDTCIDCGEFIVEGQEYYDIHGMIICKDCLNEYKTIAEVEE